MGKTGVLFQKQGDQEQTSRPPSYGRSSPVVSHLRRKLPGDSGLSAS